MSTIQGENTRQTSKLDQKYALCCLPLLSNTMGTSVIIHPGYCELQAPSEFKPECHEVPLVKNGSRHQASPRQFTGHITVLTLDSALRSMPGSYCQITMIPQEINSSK